MSEKKKKTHHHANFKINPLFFLYILFLLFSIFLLFNNFFISIFLILFLKNGKEIKKIMTFFNKR